MATDPTNQRDRGYGDHPDVVPDPVLAPEPIGTAVETKMTRATKAIVDHEIRCTGMVRDPASEDGAKKQCGRLLAECAGRPWRLRCPRCKQVNRSPDEGHISLSPR